MSRGSDDSGLAILPFNDLVALRNQGIANELAHRFFIFYQQDRFAAAERRVGYRLRRRLGRSFRERQVDMKRRAPAELALHHHIASSLLHNPVHRGKTESCSFPFFLGRKERLENSRLSLAIHP